MFAEQPGVVNLVVGPGGWSADATSFGFGDGAGVGGPFGGEGTTRPDGNLGI
ncbi:hypothetical protein ACX9NE_18875 [Mycobacterium sp. ML4]